MSAPRHDRRIHARTADGTLIVRHERAGKWYADDPSGNRYPLTLLEAAKLACEQGSYVYSGQLGGRRFDAEVRKILDERAR